jgi:heme A synthase
LAVHAATYKWRVLTQVTFICIIAQIGMGLLDVGEANNIAWMSVSAGMVGLGVLGLIAYWANDLNKWLSPD